MLDAKGFVLSMLLIHACQTSFGQDHDELEGLVLVNVVHASIPLGNDETHAIQANNTLTVNKTQSSRGTDLFVFTHTTEINVDFIKQEFKRIIVRNTPRNTGSVKYEDHHTDSFTIENSMFRASADYTRSEYYCIPLLLGKTCDTIKTTYHPNLTITPYIEYLTNDEYLVRLVAKTKVKHHFGSIDKTKEESFNLFGEQVNASPLPISLDKPTIFFYKENNQFGIRVAVSTFKVKKSVASDILFFFQKTGYVPADSWASVMNQKQQDASDARRNSQDVKQINKPIISF